MGFAPASRYNLAPTRRDEGKFSHAVVSSSDGVGMGAIKIGTCGYQYYQPGDDWQDTYESKLQAYSDAFDVGELNRTFYELPMERTAERWRREAFDEFEFTVKGWQALTHPVSSPTWNNHREQLPAGDNEEVGYLQPTDPVLSAWDQTKTRAMALAANVVVLQTPPSFDCTQKYRENLTAFLEMIERDGLTIAWEPRGTWPDHPDAIREICRDHDLVHIVDLLRADPVDDCPVDYTRLHGLNDDPYDYDYDYSTDELRELAEKLAELAATKERVYCLFNNYEMYSNAVTLNNILADRGLM